MIQGETILDAVGSEILLPLCLGAIAEARFEAGDRDAAAASVEDGLHEARKHGLAGLEIDLPRVRCA